MLFVRDKFYAAEPPAEPIAEAGAEPPAAAGEPPAPAPAVTESAVPAAPAPPEDARAAPAAPMVGDVAELQELAVEALVEAHNLTIAMARFEFQNHRSLARLALTEAEDPAGAEAAKAEAGRSKAEAVKDFFAKTIATIIKHLKAVKDWIVAAVKSIMERVFGPREEWLKEHRAALMAFPALEGDGHEVEVGDKVMKADPGHIPAGLLSALGAIEAVVKRPGDGFMERIREPFERWSGARATGATISAALEAQFVGEPTKFLMTQGTITKLVSVAEATFENVKEFGKIRSDLDAWIALAESDIGDDADRSAKLRALSFASSQLTAAIGAAVSVNSRMNGQAMAALVKAFRSIKPEKRPVAESAPPEEPLPDPVIEPAPGPGPGPAIAAAVEAALSEEGSGPPHSPQYIEHQGGKAFQRVMDDNEKNIHPAGQAMASKAGAERRHKLHAENEGVSHPSDPRYSRHEGYKAEMAHHDADIAESARSGRATSRPFSHPQSSYVYHEAASGILRAYLLV